MVVAEIADDRLVEGFGLCERDEAVAAPDERVAAEPPLFDGLEQKCSAAGCAQVEVCPERGEEIGVEDGCVVHGYEKRPCRVAGWSGSGCWRVVLYARRLPSRSLRHAHQLEIEKLIYGQG